MSTILWLILAVVYIMLFITLALTTWRKGHYSCSGSGSSSRCSGSSVPSSPRRPTRRRAVSPDPAAAEPRAPRVLFVYYTYTQQTLKMVEAMADVFRDRGCDVQQASIEFTDLTLRQAILAVPVPTSVPRPVRDDPRADSRGDGRDSHSGRGPRRQLRPRLHWFAHLVAQDQRPDSLLPEVRRRRRILDGKRFATFVVCRRYWGINLKAVRRLAKAKGGDYVDGAHWAFAGGQIKSLLSLLSYLGTGENRDSYLGVRIPPTNLQSDDLEGARTFASRLADRLATEQPA